MKTSNKNKKTFYIHQIVRKEEPKAEEKVDITTMKKKNTNKLAESVGYHLDPSRYDSLRTTKMPPRKSNEPINETPIYEQPKIINKPKKEKIEETKVNYDEIADHYVEDDFDGETQFDEVISIEEMEAMEKEMPEPEIETKKENRTDKHLFTKPTPMDAIVNEVYQEDSLENKDEEIIEDKEDNEEIEEENEIVEEEDIAQESFDERKNTFTELKQTVSSYDKPAPKAEDLGKIREYKNYVGPSLDLLKKGTQTSDDDIKLAEEQKQLIDEIISSYNIKAHVEKYIFGPTVIEYLIKFETMVEDVNSIRKCEKNLQMYLATNNIRMLTPIPNMPYAGIEVPRPADKRSMVHLGDMLSDKTFINSKYVLPVAVGKDNFNNNIYIDLSDMPHGLAAGASKSGKSVCLNTFIMSLIYHFTPNDVRIILIDPKRVEFDRYQDIPHLAVPVIVDQEYFEPVMEWLCNEMERRYKILNKYGCVNLDELNKTLIEKKESKIPYIVMFFDEFNDWFLEASNQVQIYVTRLMQKARAAGINIILATQRPSADVIKGAIKANLTTRFAFRVSSFADSSVILGQAGAEKLEGYGDMILRYTGRNDTRLQAAFVSNDEIAKVNNFLRDNNEVDYIVTLEELLQSSTSRGAGNGSSDPHVGRNDEIFEEVALYVVRNQNASVNQLLKIFGTGFNRMDAIFKEMETLGIISKAQQGTKRKVLVSEVELDEILKGI